MLEAGERNLIQLTTYTQFNSAAGCRLQSSSHHRLPLEFYKQHAFLFHAGLRLAGSIGKNTEDKIRQSPVCSAANSNSAKRD